MENKDNCSVKKKTSKLLKYFSKKYFIYNNVHHEKTNQHYENTWLSLYYMKPYLVQSGSLKHIHSPPLNNQTFCTFYLTSYTTVKSNYVIIWIISTSNTWNCVNIFTWNQFFKIQDKAFIFTGNRWKNEFLKYWYKIKLFIVYGKQILIIIMTQKVKSVWN